GLFIHECRSSQNIPKIARDVGFDAVVQGIRISNPKLLDTKETQQQIHNAVSLREFVDAYFLGELSDRHADYFAIKKALATVRWRTGKPVTASFVHDDYIGRRGDRLRELEDFSIRSLKRPWDGDAVTPEQAVNATRDALATFRDDTKPGLLTTVFFPTGGGENFTEEAQYIYFRQVLNLRIPRGVNVVFFNSFDRPWARRMSETIENIPHFEGHTGLFRVKFSNDGEEVEFQPKKAVQLFAGRKMANVRRRTR
ncbi:MAG: hypothetical protein KY475_14570, partial [Planctomycetes bacterium]|nr:hypothetical protein [Planctomycetota bacterium]